MRDRQTLEAVERMVTTYTGWELFKAEALEQLERKEDTIGRLVHRTRAPIDPIEIEYFRGFRQGVMYALEGLPNELVQQVLPRLRAQTPEQESDPS